VPEKPNRVTPDHYVYGSLEAVPISLLTARAAQLMLRMLDRGFTTVRDTAVRIGEFETRWQKATSRARGVLYLGARSALPEGIRTCGDARVASRSDSLVEKRLGDRQSLH
jgi:hypothetical protein